MPVGFELLPRCRDRAMASFLIDDVYGVNDADADAYLRFSAWVVQAGLRGEASALLGYQRDVNGRALPTHPRFAQEVARASNEHLESFMEVMTHACLYDFEKDAMCEAGPHEGVWLLDRTRSAGEYRRYFGNIARRAHDLGFRHAGLTIPGCGCPPCREFKARFQIRHHADEFNPGVHRALLELLQENRLLAPVAALFVGTVGAGPADAQVMLEEGAHAVYDVPPGVKGDHFGRWDNDPQYLDLDHYITADGADGRLAELIALGSRTLIYYGHWQSIRPDTGIGFSGFQEVAARLRKHYGDEIVWMRPTEIAAYTHTLRHTQLRPCGDAFEIRIPFAPLHPLTLRVRGSAKTRLRTPSGEDLAPVGSRPGEACALFEFLPENGRYVALL